MEITKKKALLIELFGQNAKKVNGFMAVMLMGAVSLLGIQTLEISRLQGLVQYHAGERALLVGRLEKVVSASEQIEKHSYDIERYLLSDLSNILTDTGVDVVRKLGLQKPVLFATDKNFLAKIKRPKIDKNKLKAGNTNDVLALIDTISSEQKVLSVNLAQLKGALNYKKSMIDGVPAMVPVAGWVSSGFGVRVSPFTGHEVSHEGLDIAAPVGSPIVAPADGIVRYAGDFGTYGNFVAVEHNYGIVTRYGHAEKVFVKAGDRVVKGQLIAAVGSTGRSTGPHLHYEMYVNDEVSNPKDIMRGVSKAGETNTLAAFATKRPQVIPSGIGGEQ